MIVQGLQVNVNDARVSLGKRLFSDTALSSDGKVSCQSCHDPVHAYADPRRKSIGAAGKTSTRNAPSLVGVGDDSAFFWDGRRTRLEDAVADPFTNPVELGLTSRAEVVARLRQEPDKVQNFREAFPNGPAITFEHVRQALASFVRSLTTGNSAYDRARAGGQPLSPQAERGRLLFTGVAGCSACHTLDGTPTRFTDGKYHHSGISPSPATRLPSLTQSVMKQNRDADHLGGKLLTDPEWSSLGRFVVSQVPADIGAFHTPSLRNVAVTTPYMHDGSIFTLTKSVDHEIYYRGLTTGHPINLSPDERQALVYFLESLTDESYTQSLQPGTARR